MNKTYSIKSIADNICEVKVVSNLLGKWSFQINMDYDLLYSRLETYCSQDTFIQDVFPEFSSSTREKFLTNPSIALSSFVDAGESDYNH